MQPRKTAAAQLAQRRLGEISALTPAPRMPVTDAARGAVPEHLGMPWDAKGGNVWGFLKSWWVPKSPWLFQ